MDCRTTAVHNFIPRLGFKQYDTISIKKQSVMTKNKFNLKEKTRNRNIVYQGLGLIYIFMTINLQQKLMKMGIVTEN